MLVDHFHNMILASTSLSRHLPFFAVSISTVAICWAVYLLLRNKKKPSSIPHNKLPPMIKEGMFEAAGKMVGRRAPFWVLETMREANSFIVRLPLHWLVGANFVLVGDYKVARKILNHPSSKKAPPFYRFVNYFTNGPSFFASEGARAKHVRKANTPAFRTTNTGRMHEQILDILDRWISTKLDVLIQDDKPVDITDEMQNLTISVITEASFERTLSSEEVKFIRESLETMFSEFYTKMMLRPHRELFGFLIPENRRAKKASKDLYNFCGSMLEDHRAKIRAGESVLKDSILSLMDNDIDYKNDRERICDMSVFLVAGFDTTSFTLGFAFLELARHTKDQEYLRSELKKSNGMLCPALRNVVRETLRLHPVAATGSVRETAQDITTDDGTFIPKGSVTFSVLYSIMRNGDVFQDPDEFVPNRWNEPTEAMNESFMPFSLGRRNCLGMPLANAELYAILGRVVKDYEFTVVEEGKQDFYLTLKTLGTMLRFKKAHH